MHHLAHKPLVVLDWGWIRTQSANDVHLPNTFNYLLSDVVFFEVAGCSATERGGLANKLWRLVRTNRGRVYVGRYWEEVSQGERQSASVAALQDVVRRDFTVTLREMAEANAVHFLQGIEDQRAGSEEYENMRKRFVDWCSKFADVVRCNHCQELKRMRESTDAQERWLRHPKLIGDFAVRHNPAWQCRQTELIVFPDRLALGRWCRLIAWYALQMCLGRTRDFSNNWDDAHYAFLASYTGWIATPDSRLWEAVSALFPDVVRIDVRADRARAERIPVR